MATMGCGARRPPADLRICRIGEVPCRETSCLSNGRHTRVELSTFRFDHSIGRLALLFSFMSVSCIRPGSSNERIRVECNRGHVPL
jgi:hypothetical protein